MPWLDRTGHHRRRWPCDAQPLGHPSIISQKRHFSIVSHLIGHMPNQLCLRELTNRESLSVVVNNLDPNTPRYTLNLSSTDCRKTIASPEPPSPFPYYDYVHGNYQREASQRRANRCVGNRSRERLRRRDTSSTWKETSKRRYCEGYLHSAFPRRDIGPRQVCGCKRMVTLSGNPRSAKECYLEMHVASVRSHPHNRDHE